LLAPFLYNAKIIITHRRSIAERGECFERRLFVCQFAYQHDNVGWWNLALRCTVQKSRPSSRSAVKVTEDKKRKSVAFCSGVVLWGAVLVRQFFSGAILASAAAPVGKSAHAV